MSDVAGIKGRLVNLSTASQFRRASRSVVGGGDDKPRDRTSPVAVSHQPSLFPDFVSPFEKDGG
ncbi:hypothetical protein G5B38_15290 [Pseudohalocynthiibacter aestuariivivens]|nr:hypothetical protein [Pseudohalocynthiibacter aestuariivivens]QIE46778.1 hypothetical protein G5B38_15290 [Pseudohalocynthiibacter aestuariivivens]